MADADPAPRTATVGGRSSGGAVSPRTILAVVGFGVFVAADDLTVVATMLRPIIGDLGLVLPDGLDDAAWVVNAYLIAFVAVMPIAGRVSDVIGRRRTFAAAYACFLVGTIVIPLSDTLAPFLVGRVLTAIGGGAMVPVALAVVGDVYPERRRARALGTLGAIETLGWVWGPMYGALLVRFLTWRWQFWLNVPLALVGLAVTWRVLAGHDERRPVRVDVVGAALLTVTLVSLNLALLGDAEIQSVTGLDELTGGSGPDLWWLWPVAVVAGLAFVAHQRRRPEPLIDPTLFGGSAVKIALAVNFVVGAALVITMVDVPLWVNAVEVDLERSAVVAGWILSALTAAMAVTSYVGGRWTERHWFRPPVVAGTAASAAALLVMGTSWESDSSRLLLAASLAVLGAGFGLTVAPTTSAVVDAARPERRGAAAALVMVVRLLGFSVGLSALTAWGLARFDRLRSTVDLPPITDPDFESAARAAQTELTARAITETFLATAVVVALGVVIAAFARRPPITTTDRRPDEGADVHDADDTTDPISDPTSDPTDGPADPDDTTTVAAIGSTADPTRSDDATAPVGLGTFRLVVAGLVVVLVALGAVVAWLAVSLSSTRDDLDATRADLERVEAGAAIFASQVTAFQEQLTGLAPTVSSGIDEAIVGLEDFGASTLEFTVSIDQDVAFSTDVVIQREVTVPIDTSLPISETFDTTIEVSGPFGLDIPVDVSVPVDIEVPVQLDLVVPIDETVPIDVDVPVELDVPISVDIGETELAELTTALAQGLEAFREVIDGLGG